MFKMSPCSRLLRTFQIFSVTLISDDCFVYRKLKISWSIFHWWVCKVRHRSVQSLERIMFVTKVWTEPVTDFHLYWQNISENQYFHHLVLKYQCYNKKYAPDYNRHFWLWLLTVDCFFLSFPCRGHNYDTLLATCCSRVRLRPGFRFKVSSKSESKVLFAIPLSSTLKTT